MTRFRGGRTGAAFRTLALVAGVALLAAGRASGQDVGDIGSSAIVSPTANALVAIRRSEPHSGAAMLVGEAVVDEPRVSGLARAVVELEGSYSPSPRWEVFLTTSPIAYRWLLVGGRLNEHLGYGSTTVGATWVPISLPGGRLDGGFFLRALLPTSQELPGAHAWGVQPGLTFRGVATRWMAWFAGASFRVTRAYGPLLAETRTGTSAAAGLAFVPAPWVRLVAQVSGNLPFGGGRAQVSPGVGVRLVQGPFGADLGAVLPLGGPLHPVSFVGRMSWRFDR